VEYGIALFATEYSIQPAEVARATEERGFGSLFFTEHTHIPVSRETPRPGGGELPRQYSHIYDPFVALAIAAAATGRIEIGTGVCLVNQHHPIVLAKQVASLDRLSGGRFVLGVGAGWNREEMSNHGVDPSRRFSSMRERVEAMKAIWTRDEAEYHGEHVDFDPIWSWPKPLQQPRPPVIVGGTGAKVLDRVLAYGDEWMPNRMDSPEQLKGRIDELRERAGRHVKVSFFGAEPEARALERLAWAGVDRCLLYVSPDLERGEAERQLDEFAALARPQTA
jgi:probable F420-dependent oxidoreductase